MATDNEKVLTGGRLAPMASVLEGLNDLLQLDHDSVGAYELAIDRLRDRDHAVQIEGFKKDHERHIRELNELILRLGGTPVNEPHVTGPLKQGIQRIAAVGGDASILAAWRANELQVSTKYDRYAREARAWPADAKRLIDANALDEERHYQWVVGVLSDGEAPELDLANRVREGATRARLIGEQARERIGRAGADARVRAADGMGLAAERLERFALDRGEEGAPASRAARRVAARLDSTAASLRSSEGSTLTTAVEKEIRENPGRGLAAALAIGFVLGRILR